MLLQISTFRDRVNNDMPTLIRELQTVTRRKTPEEEKAWRASLPQVAKAFSHESFADLHLYFGSQGALSLEYNLPASSSWADLVLLGRHDQKPSAVVVELKHWNTKGDVPGPYEGLMDRHGMHHNHPSNQVAGYTEYIQRFHSTVQSNDAVVHGCVLFTLDKFYHTYTLAPNANLTREYPCFSAQRDGDADRLIEYFRTRLTEPDPEFAVEFEEGTYKQNRGFVAQVGAQVLDSSKSPFVLLDNQRFAFAEVNAAVQMAIVGKKRPKKTVVIVKGPPGSGKSVVAAKVWASLVTNPALKDGNVVVATTSTAQKSNWDHLFELAGGRGAKGAIETANTYTPLTTGEFGALRKKYPDAFAKEEKWRDNMEMIRGMDVEFRSGSRDDTYLVSIVDEAHALINPEENDGRGQFGFTTAFGPQAYHIMRASVISVFFLDEQQGFRDRENTSINDIALWALELGVKEVVEVDLSGAQFRCAGSIEYIRWVDSMLGVDPPHAQSVRLAAEPFTPYEVKTLPPSNPFEPFEMRIVDGLVDMETELRRRISEGSSARFLASYSRPWATKGVAMPHKCQPEDMDFHIPIGRKGQYWSRVWNYTPGGDYSLFIQARKGYPMHEDPLCEVGCPYTVRGFDFDYVGLLWMSDLVIRDGQWIVDPKNVFETGLTNTRGRVKKLGSKGVDYERLLKAVQQSYRILLTRPIKGLYVWCEDEETREWLKRHLEVPPIRLTVR